MQVMEMLKQLWQNVVIKRAILALGVIIVVFAGYSIYLQATFRIVSTDPAKKDMSILSPYFKVNFNKKLASEGVSVSASEGIIQRYQTDGKTLTILLNYPLQQKKSYTITVNSVSATNGQTITAKKFTFTPKYANALKLTKEQEEALVSVQDSYQGPRADPIVQHLPYGTLDFNLSAVISTDSGQESHLMLRAKLLLSKADLSNKDAAVEQYKKEVTDYIMILGFKPSDYDIRYEVVTPAP